MGSQMAIIDQASSIQSPGSDATGAGPADFGAGATDMSAPGADPNAPSALPRVELPTSGGAIRSIGEKFGTDAVTGTGSLIVPLDLTAGRGGFGPSLVLSYDS